jgi:outer membrane protein assembly factor BamB
MLRPIAQIASAALLLALSACQHGGSSSTALAMTPPSITTPPSSQTAAVGDTATFTVVAAGSTPLSYQWLKGGVPIAGATSASYTTSVVAMTDDGATYSVQVSNSAGKVTSGAARLTVKAGPPTRNLLTYKYDNSRQGQNTSETVLTPANVSPATFGLLRRLDVDGKVDAQPLYLGQLTIGGAVHNVVYVVTEHDSAYAFDADTGETLWQVSLIPPGETTSDAVFDCDLLVPEIGITATPVIDRNAGAMYVVAMTKDSSTYHHRIHALDVTTGAELLGGPTEITASYTAPNSVAITFDPQYHFERAALLLANGTVYTTWTSHCDDTPYTGWIIAFSATTLARTAVLNVAPNSGGLGPAIWMAGGGPAADSGGNVYLLTGNGVFETTLDAGGFPNKQDYGNSFLKLATTGGTLTVADYFAMAGEIAESNEDTDLGSGGVMLLPDLTDSNAKARHLAVGAGKDGRIYVVDRDSMGHFDPMSDKIWQQLDGALPGGVWSTPAYFNGTVYNGDRYATLKAFTITNAMLVAQPSSQTATTFTYPGPLPVVSANGTSNAIVWAHENADNAVLHAYDATDLSIELYNSEQAPNGADRFGAGNKFIVPAVIDGKVFVGSESAVGVFGLK